MAACSGHRFLSCPFRQRARRFQAPSAKKGRPPARMMAETARYSCAAGPQFESRWLQIPWFGCRPDVGRQNAGCSRGDHRSAAGRPVAGVPPLVKHALQSNVAAVLHRPVQVDRVESNPLMLTGRVSMASPSPTAMARPPCWHSTSSEAELSLASLWHRDRSSTACISRGPA